MPPLTDILFGGETGEPIAVTPSLAGAGVTKITFGGTPAPTPPLGFTLTAGEYSPLPPILPVILRGLDLVTAPIAPMGSISPVSILGNTIQIMSTGAGALNLRINGLLDQDLFDTLNINGSLFTSASATYAQGASFTVWQWLTGSEFGPITAVTTYPVTFSF